MLAGFTKKGTNKPRRDNHHQPFIFDDSPYINLQPRDRREPSLVVVQALIVVQSMKTPQISIMAFICLLVFALIGVWAIANRTLYHAHLTSSSVGILTITSPAGEETIEGDARHFAKALREKIDLHGISSITINFSQTFERGNNSGIVKHAPYRGEIVNGYYRFVYSESGDAVSADQNLDESIRIFLTNGLGLNGV